MKSKSFLQVVLLCFFLGSSICAWHFGSFYRVEKPIAEIEYFNSGPDKYILERSVSTESGSIGGAMAFGLIACSSLICLCWLTVGRGEKENLH